MDPTLAGFILFIRNVMGITTDQLPDNSTSISFAYNLAIQIVNLALKVTCGPVADPTEPSMYASAVYLLAADRLLNFAQDPNGAPIYLDGLKFFAYTRKALNLTGFTPGVIQSTNNLTTGGTYVVPEWAKNLTIRDLSNLKTPYGVEYLAVAQDYGPTEWGIS